jgi:hypothetical protein
MYFTSRDEVVLRSSGGQVAGAKLIYFAFKTTRDQKQTLDHIQPSAISEAHTNIFHFNIRDQPQKQTSNPRTLDNDNDNPPRSPFHRPDIQRAQSPVGLLIAPCSIVSCDLSIPVLGLT